MSKTHILSAFLAFILLIGEAACYTFKGISIDPSLRTFTVRTFETTATNAPPTLAVDFSERLKDKIRSETPLALNNENPDCEFSGKITGYYVTPLAPKAGETITKNQLTIEVSVKYVINLEGITTEFPEKGKPFRFFSEFSADADLLSVQDQLIEEIRRQLLEDIFNAAFNNW